MNITQKTLATALISSTALIGVASAAEISGSFGVTTDYIWRGDTQSNGDASVSGSLDADFGNGFAVGAWVGSLGATDDSESGSANYEVNLYASYAIEIQALDVEVGYISYLYPGVADSESDFDEIYVSAGHSGLSVSYFMNLSADGDVYEDAEESYISVDYEHSLDDDMAVVLHYGVQNYDREIGGFEDNDDTSISLLRGDLAFTISGNEDDDTRAIISWGTSF